MDIKFAMALKNDGVFEKQHFSDANKFAIYQLQEDRLIFEQEVENNPIVSIDNQELDSSTKKCQAIISFLKKLNVSVLVSQQYGHSIHMIIHHFIPVIISEDTIADVSNILLKHMKWFRDELNNQPTDFKLFTLKNGILKSSIKNRHHEKQ